MKTNKTWVKRSIIMDHEPDNIQPIVSRAVKGLDEIDIFFMERHTGKSIQFQGTIAQMKHFAETILVECKRAK